ncbi:hypothetical protein BSF_12270 [Bacillus subtilis]|nr:hypothetical protein AU387_15350 [Bacillus halotolerans]PSA98781.1 hypothetical protein C6372_07790 [Bacillus halotolerans]BDG79498.1 hypothetical protein BSF_12270 [Bacillus subtilis]
MPFGNRWGRIGGKLLVKTKGFLSEILVRKPYKIKRQFVMAYSPYLDKAEATGSNPGGITHEKNGRKR